MKQSRAGMPAPTSFTLAAPPGLTSWEQIRRALIEVVDGVGMPGESDNATAQQALRYVQENDYCTVTQMLAARLKYQQGWNGQKQVPPAQAMARYLYQIHTAVLQAAVGAMPLLPEPSRGGVEEQGTGADWPQPAPN